MVDMAPVVVSGAQPGPGLWKVSRDGHELWILATVSPLPAKMRWRADEVESVIARAQQVLDPPGWSVGADVGLFKGLTLLPAAMKAARNPDGRRLQDVLPADLYARWSALKQRYIGRDGGIEKDRPMVAANELYRKALAGNGLGRGPVVSSVVAKAAKAHGIKPVSTVVKVQIADPRQALKDIRGAEVDDVECFRRTLDAVEHDLPTMVERANAWAVGDIEALRSLPMQGGRSSCVDAVERTDFARKYGMTDMDSRVTEAWLAAARQALQHNEVTFARLPLHLVLAPDGYLSRLQALGYTVEAPEG